MDEEKTTLLSPESEEKNAIFGFLKPIALGVAICEAITVLVFAIIGKLSLSVVLGAVYGGLIMILYYYLMARGIAKAAKEPDPDVAKKRIQLSYSKRIMTIVILFGIGLFLYAEFGIIHWVPMALSIIYPRIALGVWQQRYRKMAKDEPLTPGNPDAYKDIDENEEEADI